MVRNAFLISEDAFQHLPEEIQSDFRKIAEDGRKVLSLANRELSKLAKLSVSMYQLTTLKYMRDRLASYNLKLEMDSILELEMLTTAFLTTYVRLHTGKNLSTFSRDILPADLKAVHDEILDMRNKRYGHIDEHESITDEMEIEWSNERFVLHLSTSYGFYIGGSNEWPKIVDFIESLLVERAANIIEKLKAKTGHVWEIAKMNASDVPIDVRPATIGTGH